MSNRNKIHSKGRIQGQWTAVRWEVMQSAAWKQMSMGARMLYIALIKNLSFNADNNGKVFLATRKAADELGASQRIVCVWFRELEHYGFTAMTEPGTAMRAARWRITDVGWGRLDGKAIEPTKDYLKWDGELFDREPKKIKKGEEQKYSLRGKKVLRGIDEQKYSTTPHVEEKTYSEERLPVEEKKYSELVQPSPISLECVDGEGKLPWSTPQLVDITDELSAAELRALRLGVHLKAVA
jgi:hypothetical protein